MAIISLLRGTVAKPQLAACTTICRIYAVPLAGHGRPLGTMTVAASETFGGTPVSINSIRQFATTSFRLGGGGDHQHHAVFNITPSRWTWSQYKNDFHFYVMLGVLPLLFIVFLVNVFIGPATLAPYDPEEYVPKHWEHYKHPISRWMARYICQQPQENYERNMFYLMEEDEKRKMRFLAWRVEDLMSHRGDYPNYFNNPTLAGSYLRMVIDNMDYIYKTRGFESERIETGDDSRFPED